MPNSSRPAPTNYTQAFPYPDQTTHQAVEDDDGSEDYALLSASEEVTIQLSYLDRHGRIQHAMIRTSNGDALHSDGNRVLEAIQTCFEALGCELMSTLVIEEEGQLVLGEKPRPSLWVVR